MIYRPIVFENKIKKCYSKIAVNIPCLQQNGGRNGTGKERVVQHDGSGTQICGCNLGKEPVGSGELVRLCEERFGWKKSTTYTFLKKLCEQGLFENQDSRVSARIDKESYDQSMGERFVQETYGGRFQR